MRELDEVKAENERLRAALAKVLIPSCVGECEDNPDSYHDNEHHSSCALGDCGCLERHVRAALAPDDGGE
jgi:hypothetical protein